MKKLLNILIVATVLTVFFLAFSPLCFADQTATVAPGKTVTFSLTVSGTPPFTYQWQKDGVAIAGATGATYVIPSIAAVNAGSYTCVISNLAGNATSDKGIITVAVLPNGQITVTIT